MKHGFHKYNDRKYQVCWSDETDNTRLNLYKWMYYDLKLRPDKQLKIETTLANYTVNK